MNRYNSLHQAIRSPLSSSSSSSSSPSSPSYSPSTLSSTLTTLTLILIACLILFGDPSTQFGFAPKLITRFCYNSPNLSTLNSQCVLCNYYMFDATVLGCTGSTALTMNITSTQAFCVISQCLGQIRQSPVFLGRRKREDHPENDSTPEIWDVLNNSTRNQYEIKNEVNADVFDEDRYYGIEE